MIVNGVQVEVMKCHHDGCRAEPTEADIKRAVTSAQQIRECPQWRCAHCGKPVKATGYKVYHDSQGWAAMENGIEPAISMRILPQNAPEVYEYNGLHLECVKKALPFVNGLAQKR
jgi:hypothetical protein